MSSFVVRTPFLVFASLAFVASAAPVAAQRSDPRRVPRSSTADSLELQLRWLQRAADSLGTLFYDEDLSASARRAVGAQLDRIIGQYRLRSMRMAQLSAEDQANALVMRLQAGPISSATIGSNSANALTESIAREATPRGWIGIVLMGAATEARVERGELILHYFSYPLIASVEPGSPAQRAGLAPNDTLLAYNGRDVRDADISMTRLLQPNTKLLVRVRRDGRSRELPVMVAATPSRIKQRRDEELRDAGASWVMGGVAAAPWFPRTPPPASGLVGIPRTNRPLTPVSTVAPPLPPAPPNLTFIATGVAGAQMVTLTEGLGKTFGLQYGVLVANAPAGSPAAESGLRDGDVIVKVESQPVRNVAEVRELIGQAVDSGERSVELETMRDKRTRKVTLRW
ncbi:MAG: hypothetical protein JWL95_1047 [Gemmatimonadetes bacterium]|nr:hypothetical protein [Gemmatimonadota bacterium]